MRYLELIVVAKRRVDGISCTDFIPNGTRKLRSRNVFPDIGYLKNRGMYLIVGRSMVYHALT